MQYCFSMFYVTEMTYKRNEDKNEEHCIASLAQSKIESDLHDYQDKEVSPSDVDLIPKDTGWAWMCCLGTISLFFVLKISDIRLQTSILNIKRLSRKLNNQLLNATSTLMNNSILYIPLLWKTLYWL